MGKKILCNVCYLVIFGCWIATYNHSNKQNKQKQSDFITRLPDTAPAKTVDFKTNKNDNQHYRLRYGSLEGDPYRLD